MLKLATGIGRAMTFVSIVLMLLLCLPIAYEAVARSLKAPTIWVFETTLYAFIFLGFLANALAVRSGAHFRVMLLPDLFPAARPVFEMIAQVATLAFALLIFASGAYFAWNSYSKDILAGTMLNTPLWIPQLAIPLGGLGLFLQTLVQMITGERPLHVHAGD